MDHIKDKKRASHITRPGRKVGAVFGVEKQKLEAGKDLITRKKDNSSWSHRFLRILIWRFCNCLLQD